jgi:predicted ATP-grasp superfamily ATP-dependent carboligase
VNLDIKSIKEYLGKNPVAICSFLGWNDAAETASNVIDHLIEVWDATELTAIDPDPYYDYQVARPRVRLTDDGKRVIDWPTTRIFLADPPGSPNSILLVQGIEPNLKWKNFVSELLDIFDDYEVSLIISCGALLADAPHTRPVPVTTVAATPELTENLDLEPSAYEGPTGIIGIVQDEATERDIASISLWAAIPHYVSSPPNPKATLAVISKLEDLLDISIPLNDLIDESRAWQEGVDQLSAEDDEIKDYVTKLESSVDASDLPEASGEAIAREFERYLKRRTKD